jgi:serine/threonine protein phosphatase PrpC
MTIVTINQDTDTPARREVLPGLVLTYIFDRSRDSKKNNAPGQDFICYAHNDDCLAFAVCDGVSQSFYGDIAARYIGEHLVTWLAGTTISNDEAFAAELDQKLNAWVEDGNALVQAKQLKPSLPPMLKDALERKRENGSEAMFIAGRIDLKAKQLALCWMGDMQFWLWDKHGAAMETEAVSETKDRWSSRIGPKSGATHGSAYSMVKSLRGITRLTVHSDGIGSRTDALRTISLASLDQLVIDLGAAPASDDVSIFDVAFQTVKIGEPLPSPILQQLQLQETTLLWSEIPEATAYRVRLETSTAQWTVDVPSNTYFLPVELATQGVTCGVQALSNEHPPGVWSEPLVVQLSPVEVATMNGDSVTLKLVIPKPPFRFTPILVLSLILAAVLSIGWIVLFVPR